MAENEKDPVLDPEKGRETIDPEKKENETAQDAASETGKADETGRDENNDGSEANADDAKADEPMDAEFVDIEEENPKRGGFFKKKKDKELEKKDQQIEELNDRVRRQMAEFDNFRKRTEKEKAAMFEIGAKSVIEKILPIVDNFERGLPNPEEESEDPVIAGMQKVYKQLITALEAMEVKPIPAKGEEFNPEFHNAVMHVEDESVGENIIVEEFQKGYTYRESVVRHSMVKVAN